MQLISAENAAGTYTTSWHGGRGHVRLWGTLGAGVTASLVWAEEGETPTKIGASSGVFEATDEEVQSFFELPAGVAGIIIEGSDVGTSLSASIHKLPAT